MSALSLRRWSGRDVALMIGVLIWAGVMFAIRLDFVVESGPGWRVLTYGVPTALLLSAWFWRADPGVLVPLAASTFGVLLALWVPSAIAAEPRIAYALPVAAFAGILSQRYPTAVLVAMLLFIGFYGSAEAFLHIPGDRSPIWLLEALWIGVVGRLLLGRRTEPVRVTPVLFLLAGYLLITIVGAVTTTPTSSGIRAMRYAPQYLSVALLIGYGGFSTRVLDRAARGLLVVCFLVDAYAALRWAIGPATAERSLLKTYNDIIYNSVTLGGSKVQGSFPNGNTLGLWLACTTPFVLAAGLAWRGVLRVMALATLPLGAIALFGSGQRTATVATVAGLIVVVVVNAISRGHRGPRLGVLTAAILALILSAAVFFPAVVNNPENRQRYSNVLTPTQDLSVQERLNKWQQAVVAIDEQTFGHGLGSGNPQAVGGFRFTDISTIAIDNSYLIIGYEQGLVMMLFFIVAMLFLLVELLRFAVWTRGPGSATMGTAAVGTLVALLIELVAANYLAYPAIMAGWAIIGLGLAAFSRGEPSSDEGPIRDYAPYA